MKIHPHLLTVKCSRRAAMSRQRSSRSYPCVSLGEMKWGGDRTSPQPQFPHVLPATPTVPPHFLLRVGVSIMRGPVQEHSLEDMCLAHD